MTRWNHKYLRAQGVLQSMAMLLLFLPDALFAEDFALAAHERNFIDQNCVYCHDAENSEGGLNLEDLRLDATDPFALTRWARVHDRIASREMPPAGEERPEPAAVANFTRSISAALTEAWQTRYTTRGRTAGRRLNPLEYEMTLRDLLSAPWLELKDMLPPDPESNGFDNVAAVQEISYVQLARYLEAAEVAIDSAIRLRPAPEPKNVRTWFSEEGRYLGKDWRDRYKPINLYHRPTQDATESDELLDWPEWTWFWQQPNSAQTPRHIRNTNNQVPGWYRFRVRCRAGLWDHGKLLPAEEGQVASVVTAAKRVLGKFDVPESEEGGVVEFIAWQNEKELIDFFCLTMDDRQVSLKTKKKDPQSKRTAHEEFMKSYRGHGIAVDWFEIEGPYAEKSCMQTARAEKWPASSYQTLFGDLPIEPWTAASGLRAPQPLNRPDLTANKRGLRETFQLPPALMMVVSTNPKADAQRLLRRFMRRAYRAEPDDSEVERCLAFAHEAIDQKACFQDAMRLAYKAVLCSPDFLYLQEPVGRLDNSSLAARLSYFLWRSMPDEQLLEASLQSDDDLLRQLDHMLRDSRTQRMVSDFVGQWLDLRKIHETSPDRYLFPEYFSDDHVVASAVEETEATVDRMIRENLPIRTVIDADFVMINERLAAVYGIEDVKGGEIRKVTLPPDHIRGGLLTQASVMKVTANGLTTSPVLRGAWVMDRILGQPPLPPPPGAGSIDPDTRGATTVRELLAKHSRSATCAGCHRNIDPPGFALENFDVMGKWREHYRSFGEGKSLDLKVALRPVRYKRGLPVDASGVTSDDRQFRDIREYKTVLLGQEEQIARNLVERLLTFATGAGVTFADRAEVDKILRSCQRDGYRLRSLIEGVVLSKIFRNK